MNHTILKVENISKQYRLGLVGTGTLTHDLNRFWHKIRGKEDPYLQIGAVNDRSANASSDYVWALQDINFEVKRGEILGIIGKNGAGKSTLLKILSRVTSPTTGSIKTKGRIASLLEVGTGMHPELTGRENIYLNGAILGMNKTEISSKIDEIIEFSGCQMYIDTPVKRYSSGMRVRLGFAVAAFLEPDILVVDEVLAVGDAEFQKKAIGKMQDISSTSGRTVLFVSHNMASINDLCTRCIVLENGSVKFDGNTALAIDQYLSINNESEQNSIYINPQPNTEADILKVSVLKNDKPNCNFGFDDEINVKIEFSITENLKKSFIGIRVVNFKNVNIFSSEKSLSEFEKGTHSLTVKIPSEFLVPNFYYINIGYHVPNVHLINYTEHAVEFHIEETGSDLSQFAGKDFGCVMVDCEWY
ncbi:ABC transporter ATP-binding protein [Dokdonia sp. Dokd-P16]|uniref:ABC transporter ATP-binding protein n=1 Tax=Dokdonia sp. Dokd-P16 TaxID=2173169 RepID=UPI000D54A9FC|nr:ABC transporter ATP-binding protein [Dokdonia sp. Dokd-P16]AWH72888.1 ABC transporter ATP-binding protein [Dokdonia sp. Dokd-P16]